jgi:hypothetical protein
MNIRGHSKGDEISALVVDKVERSDQRRVKKAKESPAAKRALEALKRVIEKHGTTPEGDGFPDGVTVVPLSVWREEAIAVDAGETTDAKRISVKRAIERLRKDGRVDVRDDFVWPVAA